MRQDGEEKEEEARRLKATRVVLQVDDFEQDDVLEVVPATKILGDLVAGCLGLRFRSLQGILRPSMNVATEL